MSLSLDPTSAISALKWLGSLVIEEGTYLYQVPEEVNNLLDELHHMQRHLQDADDEHQVDSEDGQLLIFSQKLRQLAFRAEDVIDTYLVDIDPKIENKNKSFFTKFFCICFHSYPIHQIGNEIQSIQKDVQAANRRLQDFRMAAAQRSSHRPEGGQGGAAGSSSRNNNERLKDIPGRNLTYRDEFVVGIENDIKNMVTWLVDGAELSDCGDNNIDHHCRRRSRFVAITGTSGVGKTTLAKKLHRHPLVVDHFRSTALVTISKEWSGKFILVEIIRQTIGLRDEEWSSIQELSKPALVAKLHSFLEGKRYLVMIDDIWKKEAWDDISEAFPDDENGSKIVLTTRIDDLPSSIDTNSLVHEPRYLGSDEKYELFRYIAIEGRSSKDITMFEDLAREMLRNCSGIPLAVVSLAGILSRKKEVDQWERVKNSLAANVLKGKGGGNYGGVEDMLGLSYYHLPSNVRPCLLYLAVFPEDYVICSGMLIRMLVAEGLIAESDRENQQETLEDVGVRVLDELTRQCFLIAVKRCCKGRLKQFLLHDLVREFCIKKAKEQCFLDLLTFSNGQRRCEAKAKEKIQQARRTVVHSRRQEKMMLKAAEAFHIGNPGIPAVRSLIHLVRLNGQFPTAKALNLGNINQDFKLLKVLCLRGVNTVVLPDQIGDLTHLKYFDVRYSSCKGPLPKSVRKLKSLLTFDFRNSDISMEKTSGGGGFFSDMEHLEHVYLSVPAAFGAVLMCVSAESTTGLGNTKNLQTLRGFFGGDQWMTKDLPSLKSLRKMYVIGISSQQQVGSIYQCPSFSFLHVLDIRGSDESHITIDMRQLEECLHLRKLGLHDFYIVEEEEEAEAGRSTENINGSVIRFPPNLTSLTLGRTELEKRDSVSAIARLSFLKYLRLERDAYVGEEVIVEDKNSFLQLEELQMYRMHSLKKWRVEKGIGGGDLIRLLPCLIKVSIIDCPALENISPELLRRISTLQNVEIEGCPRLAKKVKKKRF